jgi:type IV pilus assembly protein PilP
MKKNLIIFCNLACLICFFMVLMGCDQPASKPATPKIVRKKIRAPEDEKTATPGTPPVRKAQPVPAVEPSVPETQKGAPPPVLAKKPEAPAVAPQRTAKPKPPVEPKSDISAGPLPAPGEADRKTATGQPEESPDGPQTAMAKASASSRPIYNPKGKVDPFEPLFREKPEVAVAKKQRKKRIPRTPLEKIDLSQLKLVGIILASSGNKALVEESNGKGYVIKAGTYVGTNAGKVVQIEKDKVIVAEEYEDVLGNVSIRNKELKLPKPPGEF